MGWGGGGGGRAGGQGAQWQQRSWQGSAQPASQDLSQSVALAAQSMGCNNRSVLIPGLWPTPASILFCPGPHLEKVGGGVKGDCGGLVGPPRAVHPVGAVEHRQRKVLAVQRVALAVQLRAGAGGRAGSRAAGGPVGRLNQRSAQQPAPPARACAGDMWPHMWPAASEVCGPAQEPCTAATALPPLTCSTALSFSSLPIRACSRPVISGARPDLISSP